MATEQESFARYRQGYRRFGLVGDNPPVVDLVLELNATAVGENSTLTLQPEGTPLDAERHGEFVSVQLPTIAGYSIVEVR